MNIILLEDQDFVDQHRVRLKGRRFEHLRGVQRATCGDELRVGRVDGLMGRGKVIALDHDSVSLDVCLDRSPPEALPVTLLLALPRPKMLKRILQTCATMGVRDLVLIHSYRVEKSYWQTPFLHPDSIHQQLLLGLEQGVATQLPRVHQYRRFKPFVEDILPGLAAGQRRLLAHPYKASPCPPPSQEDSIVAVGPEGGFIQYEVDKLIEAGFQAIELGPRILRVETALTVLLGRLF